MVENYRKQLLAHQKSKMIVLLEQLPSFCRALVDEKLTIEHCSVSTVISYLRDWGLFFNYMIRARLTTASTPKDIGLEEVARVTYEDLKAYEATLINSSGIARATQARRRTAVRILFRYLFVQNLLPDDPTKAFPKLKLKEAPVVYLEPQDQARLLNVIESDAKLSSKEMAFRKKHPWVVKRDVALVTFLIDTGLRVSECQALDLDAVDLENYEVYVTGKGEQPRIAVFSEDTAKALKEYLAVRPKPPVEDSLAIFLNPDGERLSTRTIQNLVKKYASKIGKTMITPHKLRATCAINILDATGDIYTAAMQLGHRSVDVTAKRYLTASRRKQHDALRQRGSLR